MPVFKDIPIRTKDELSRMGEIGTILKSLVMKGVSEIPVTYQYMRGKPGDSVINQTEIEKQRNTIGMASNLHIDQNDDIVCDVAIFPMITKSMQFQGRIDNFVIAKNVPISQNGDILEKDNKGKPIVSYALVNLIVYDRITVEAMCKEEHSKKVVRKTYNAPTEIYDVDPSSGEVVRKVIDRMENELTKTIKEHEPWKRKEV